jgi:hypothetical protein
LILPDMVLGKADTNSIRRGYLYGTIVCFTYSWICSASAHRRIADFHLLAGDRGNESEVRGGFIANKPNVKDNGPDG